MHINKYNKDDQWNWA